MPFFTWLFEYIAGISWQIVVISVVFYFKDDIKIILQRCTGFNMPGGIAVQMAQFIEPIKEKGIDEQSKQKNEGQNLEIKPKAEHNSHNDLLLQIDTLQKLLDFERIFRVIYGSQLNFLGHD